MSDTGNFAMEMAEARVEQERDTLVAQVRAGLPSGDGLPVCSCGDPIPEARRKALPGARDCISCAQEREARGRR